MVIGAGISAALGIASIVLSVGRVFPEGAPARVLQYLSIALQEILLLGLPALLLWLTVSDRKGAGELFEKPDALSVGIAGLGAVSFVGASVLLTSLWVTVLQSLEIGFALPAGLESPVNTGEYLLVMLCAALVPALCEEMFFRGLLLHLLRRRLSSRAAALLSALLFALLHLSLPGFVALLAIGMFLSLLVIRTNHLWVAVIFHAVYNGLVIVLNALKARPSLGTVLLFSAVFAGVCWYLNRYKGEQGWS